jgi:hypothetical protein
MSKNPKFGNRFDIDEAKKIWILKFYKEIYVGGNITHFLVKFRNSKIHNVFDIKLIFLKLWIFTNLNTLFPVVV